MLCNQCGKPAIARVGSTPLCVDCTLKVQQALELQNSRQARMINFLLGMAEDTVGFPGIFTRYEVPEPTIHAGPTTYHNIRVDGSVVGAINTGEIRKLDVAMNHVRAGGDPAIAEALRNLTQGVVDARDLPASDKNAILEHLSCLAAQAVLPEGQRQKSLGKTVLRALERLLTASASLASVWSALKPMLERLF